MEGSPPQCPLIHMILSSRVVVRLKQDRLFVFKFFGCQEVVFETVEVVGCLPLFRLFCLSLSFYNDFSIASKW